MRRAATVAAALLAATGLAAPATAAPAPATSAPQRFSVSFDEEPVVTPVDGLGTGCPAFTGTLTERRHLQIDGLIQPDGTAHARTLVTASVTLAPSDPTTPSYAGGYTSRQSGLFSNGGNDDRVVTTTTHGTIIGTDGSSYRISEVVHLTLDAHGSVRAWFDRFHCS
jgi:hypothetical protein